MIFLKHIAEVESIYNIFSMNSELDNAKLHDRKINANEENALSEENRKAQTNQDHHFLSKGMNLLNRW